MAQEVQLVTQPATTTTRPSNTTNTRAYLDREQRGVAEMLDRFMKLVSLASMKDDEKENVTSAVKEHAAAQSLAMEVETAALVKTTQDLLQLSRELKELWLFGPLRDIGEGEGEGSMDVDSVRVGQLAENILRKDAESTNAASGSGS
ncbi:hypothetical protein G7Y89_g6 [Cudoniella acicularis]|uniref:Mediator of RNA polymerase II transcription subunit 22 n=1 Tax=Cudoniella acicularis TaxID=354080 RepID=A0A8H4W9A3_9HELO|nr:hypothetical protein G7Y89_g6 [Cudoniella acicularis]